MTPTLASASDRFFELLPALMMLPLLGTGIGAVIVGMYVHTHPGKWNRGRNHTQQMLISWRIEDSEHADPQVVAEFIRARDVVQSSAFVGMGVCLIIVVAGLEILSWIATQSWFWSGTLLLPVIFVSYVLGYGLGYLYGMWSLQRQTAAGVTYADLHPRGLADYRSCIFPVGVGSLIAGLVLLTLLLWPHLGRQVPLQLGAGAGLELPLWILCAVPAAMVFTFMITERVMAAIAGSPRLLVTSLPQTSQRADNLLRALTIGTLLSYEFIAIAGFAATQMLLIVPSLWQSGFWRQDSRPYDTVLTLEFVFCMLFYVLSVFVIASDGRLGGRITGWLWRRPLAS